ncbi:ABC transporter permease [Streptomyces sp. KR55]|uniref:ABC transporter permease n=1 Tax=Streptomyces sp. KR55 TaxID=3457425 RepID=UPI003FD3F5CA
MALVPLVRASRTTVRAAIDHHGGGTAPGRASALLARISRIRRLDRGLLLALRNTVRRPARFWLSVSLLACAGTVFVAAMSLIDGTNAAEQQKKAQRYWDVEAELGAPAAPDQAAAAVKDLPGVSRVETFTRTQVSVAGPDQLPFSRTYPDQGHGSIALNTVLPSPGSGRSSPKLLEGSWPKQGETGAVILSQIVRDNTVPGYSAGDTVRLFIEGKPTTWRIAGIVEERDSTGGGVYATPEGLAAATGEPQQVNRVRVITDIHDERTRDAVAASVDDALTADGVDVALAASVNRSEAASAGHTGPVLMVLLVIALPLGLVGGIGLGSTMSSNILDRTREFGVMHAIGARPKAVRRIVVAEGVLLAVTSCVVAVAPALALTAFLGDGLGNLFMKTPLPFRISPLGVGVWVVLAVLGSMLATEAAASRASRITVREALTYL